MLHSHSLLAGLGLCLTVSSALAQAPAAPVVTTPPESVYPRTSLGINLGWGAPYGWGVDLNYLVAAGLDVGVGVGASITGTKIGVGARYHFRPASKVSPFAGLNLVRSGGISNLRVTANNNNGGYGTTTDEAVVNFMPAALLHVRGGVRWQPGRHFGLLGALGYGVVLGANPVEYVQAPAQQSTRTAVNIVSPGGVEFSMGIVLGLGSR